MDQVLQHALLMAVRLRDASSATSWRTAWENIAREARTVRRATVRGDSARSAGRDFTLAETLVHLRTGGAFNYHPVLYSYFLRRATRHTDADLHTLFSSHPQLLAHYVALEQCFRAITLVIGSIRRIGAGYPHRHLPYVEPMRVWNAIERVCEVPWPETVSAVPVSPSLNIRQLGLDTLLGADASPVSDNLENLLRALQSTREVQELNGAYEQVVQNGLLIELGAARGEFGVRYAELRRQGLRGEELGKEAFVLVLEIYFSRNRIIRNYIEGFERYERLVQRIYWLISQLIFYRIISCVTTRNPNHLQQVLLLHEEEIYVTAVAPTNAHTLHAGQLVHITMPELAGIYDAVFQVRQWNLDWDVGTGARAFVRAEPHWGGRLHLLSAAVAGADAVFVPSAEEPFTQLLDGISLSMPVANGFGPQTRLRDMSSSFNMNEALRYPD
jgi:hypothetical protein